MSAVFVPKDTYPADDYIKRLAVIQTPCFGVEFNYGEKTCQTCPLSGSCEAQFLVNLSEVSRQMLESGDMPEVLEPDADVPEIEQVESTPLDNVQEFDAFVGSKCIVCGEDIKQGVKAKYHMREGFWHISCHDNYLKGVRAP